MLVSILLGIVAGIVINEVSFLLVKTEAGRAPQRVELLIPEGTAERVAQGQANPALPDKMVFVVGDILSVKNEDHITHQLGPLSIPAGTSASMTLNQADNMVFTCSFQPTAFQGLDVREPVTIATRIYGVLIAGVPLGLLFALYSFLVWPLRKKEQPAE
jgi:hypothetical protein